MHVGIRFDEYGAVIGSVHFTKVSFYRFGKESDPSIRYFQDSSGTRWWVRRDCEQFLGHDNYTLARYDKNTQRIHATVGDVNRGLREGLRCLLRSSDIIDSLRKWNSQLSKALACSISDSMSVDELDPKPPAVCTFCHREL